MNSKSRSIKAFILSHFYCALQCFVVPNTKENGVLRKGWNNVNKRFRYSLRCFNCLFDDDDDGISIDGNERDGIVRRGVRSDAQLSCTETRFQRRC